MCPSQAHIQLVTHVIKSTFRICPVMFVPIATKPDGYARPVYGGLCKQQGSSPKATKQNKLDKGFYVTSITN